MNKIYQSGWWSETSGTRVAVAAAVLWASVPTAHAAGTAATLYFDASGSGPSQFEAYAAPNMSALAAGMKAYASGPNSVALGVLASATGLSAVALGHEALAQLSGAFAGGMRASAIAVNSTALGALASATDTGATSLGAQANASAQAATAIGFGAVANVRGATAFGSSASAAGRSAVALGDSARASAATSAALGANAWALHDNSVALGAGSVTLFGAQTGYHAFGLAATQDSNGEVNIGNRTLSGLAAGSADQDAVNVGQLKALADAGKPHYFKADGADNGTDDASALAGTNALAAGRFASATATEAVAIGAGATASMGGAIALGSNAGATGVAAIAIGNAARATGTDSLALGDNAWAIHGNSVALGASSVTRFGAQTGYTAYGLAVPQNSMGEVNVGNRTISSLAPGRDDRDAVNVAQLKAVAAQADAAAVKVDGALMYDTNADGTVNRNSVTLGGDAASGATVLHNVANGVDATDAVNLGQLNAAISGAVSNIAVNTTDPFFGAQGDSNTEGALASGTHSVAAGANAQATGANAVAAGASAQATGTNAVAAGASAQATGTNAVAMGANSVASGNNATALGASANAGADNSVALGQGSVADRANTVSVGAAGQERQIANVAAGVQGTDAVNVNQLQQSVSGAVGQANRYTDDQIRSARRDAYGGTASALAVAGLPQAVLPGRGMIAMAGGTYGGQSAVAIGVSQLSETGKWVYKVQGTSDSRGQFGASLGAGMHW
ncbi:YadA-like family protein [Paraburkholderia fungorum]|uniref:YadA-like family protein n=1 Tax=Paraburkholderia fungorum TaxID=134537 RepID=A0AAP5Q2Q7_9BURK|nr:YadA-like family protein [Paraburkholderia fungorum]MDT8836013.1 YadA-like family protein [Paraburkholderia fungorum]PRZ56676.1 autotransporter adhesin [Paraburkholderia fungorum]